MRRCQVQIVNRLGLHARAAARFATLAGEYTAAVTVHFSGHSANGKSIMGLMMLAAGQGSELELVAEGPDAEQAIAGIRALVADGFGETD
ncbi:HPr family phosphocarrier protein [Spiribacter vilamensis]|nr:HPr family phosphocarrier protein [Spiribacter vilamensis]TVO62354.1 HPr family phosphocarrier protein [Spiribacter vilamensis]